MTPINPTTASVVVDGDVVRKTLHRPADPGPQWSPCEHPADWNWWGRELLALRSGLLPDGPLRMPRLLSYEDRGHEVELTLHREAGDLQDLETAAHHLGRAQALLTRSTGAGWLAPDWAAGYARARRSHAARARADLPLTVCHGDVWPPNLLRGGAGTTCLLDWGWAHLGPMGEDLATLVVESVLYGFIPAGDAATLAKALVEAYAHGAGHDVAVVNAGVCQGLATKYAWLARALREEPDPRWRLDDDGRAIVTEWITG